VERELQHEDVRGFYFSSPFGPSSVSSDGNISHTNKWHGKSSSNDNSAPSHFTRTEQTALVYFPRPEPRKTRMGTLRLQQGFTLETE